MWILFVEAISEDTKGTVYYYNSREWMEEDTKPECGPPS